MKRVALLLLLPLSVLAGSLSLNWTVPTKNTDGSNLTDGTSYKLYCANTSAGVATATPVTIPGINTTSTTLAFPAGPVFCSISTVSTSGGEGPRSNIAQGVVPASVPNPPSNVTMTTSSGIAYKMRQAVDGYSLVRVGTVPAGIMVDGSHTIDGLCVVPRDSVKFDSPIAPKPLIVVGPCS